jgi:hypothetical protein
MDALFCGVMVVRCIQGLGRRYVIRHVLRWRVWLAKFVLLDNGAFSIAPAKKGSNRANITSLKGACIETIIWTLR